ncbi:MAG: hypothetical protein D3916_10130 [Candidatus Electrothrix sp. MAN1_4]|nr:hypothetical protein [Candidatus Electrothrix sp. MAN1_4]
MVGLLRLGKRYHSSLANKKWPLNRLQDRTKERQTQRSPAQQPKKRRIEVLDIETACLMLAGGYVLLRFGLAFPAYGFCRRQ